MARKRSYGPLEETAMKIREAMTANPHTVGPNDSIQAIAAIMRDEDTGVVPVVEKGKLIGVVTDRDIVIRCVADGSFNAKATDACSDEVITVTADMSIADAADLMAEHQIRRLPVVEGERLVGIVSLGDIAVKEGKDKRTGDTLEDISQGVKH
jgi:CBS domain-containing protein